MTNEMDRDGIAIVSPRRVRLSYPSHSPLQVGIAAQLPSGSYSTEDLDYASFWDFLVGGGKAYEPLANILPDVVQYVNIFSSSISLIQE
jgi:hypothetical protein